MWLHSRAVLRLPKTEFPLDQLQVSILNALRFQVLLRVKHAIESFAPNKFHFASQYCQLPGTQVDSIQIHSEGSSSWNFHGVTDGVWVNELEK